MSMNSDGGPAFPHRNEWEDGRLTTTDHPGMSLRDWFAARAPEPPMSWWGNGSKDCAGYALWAFQYADAMLAERAKLSVPA